MGSVDRAERFGLRLTAWYRTADEPRWHRGTTRNISRSGVFIDGDDPPDRAYPLAVVVSLPSDGCLVGCGSIVNAGPAAVASFALAFDTLQIARGDLARAVAVRILQACHSAW